MKPRCEATIVLNFSISSADYSAKAEINDQRQCAFNEGHSGKHEFLLAVLQQSSLITKAGKAVMAKVSW